MAALNATSGDPGANSYLTVDEANDYFSMRLGTEAWDDADSPDIALMMATRTIDSQFQGVSRLIATTGSSEAPYYVTGPAWSGTPASATQALAWPRIGMYDRNGNPISSSVIPRDLKYATAEFAMQLLLGDRTLDNDVITQGITSIKAGSVALTFKNSILPQVVPDAVRNLLVPSWILSEIRTYADNAFIDVITGDQ